MKVGNWKMKSVYIQGLMIAVDMILLVKSENTLQSVKFLS